MGSIGDADPTPSPHFECPDEDDYYPNPTNCKAFYQCVNGTAWQQECPADLYFNPILKVYDYKENVDCKQDTIKTIRDVEPTPSPTFKCPEEQGFYSNPTDCSKFYLCANYLAWEQQCPGKLLFNMQLINAIFLKKSTAIRNLFVNPSKFQRRTQHHHPSSSVPKMKVFSQVQLTARNFINASTIQRGNHCVPPICTSIQS